MIEDFFKDLIGIDGIEAVVLFSRDNKIADKWAVTNFNLKIFDDGSINYIQIFSAAEKNKVNLNEIVLSYEKGQIYARKLKNHLLLIVARFKVDIYLIRLIVNVATIRMESSKKYQKIFKKNEFRKGNFLSKSNLDDVEQKLLEKSQIMGGEIEK